MTRVIDRPVLILNRLWEPVGVFDVATAITTVIRDMGWVVDPETYELHTFTAWQDLRPAGAALIKTTSGAVPAPEIVVLKEYAAQPKRGTPFTRKNLYRRDDYRCQFCGKVTEDEERTIDHVHPRSRGGPTSWENCVLSCAPCNRRKADRPPREAGMRLLKTPRRPPYRPTLSVAKEHFRPSWKSFMAKSKWDVELR